MKSAIFLASLTAAGNAVALTAPSSIGTFTDFFGRAKLQFPDSSLHATSEDLLDGFVGEQCLSLLDDNSIRMQVAGALSRCEFREMLPDGGKEKYWPVNDNTTHSASISVFVPPQKDGVDQVNFLQIHFGSISLMRIFWLRELKQDGEVFEEPIVATIRVSGEFDEDEYLKTVLKPTRPDSFMDIETTCVDSKISITIDGETMVENVDVSAFDGLFGAYYKGGVYNIKPSDEDAVAETHVRSINW